jgi:hypothetical protein
VQYEEVTVMKEHIPTGTEVIPGVYRCNACANEHEIQEEGEKLPICCACDSISWRTYRLAKDCKKEKKE